MPSFLIGFFSNVYFGLFAYSLLASTLIPFGSEGFLALFISQGFNIPLLILSATVGNYLGSVTNYYIGLKGSKTIFHKVVKFSGKEIGKAERLFKKYGPVVLFFSWIPIIGDPLTMVAGLLKYDFKKFTFYVLSGKLLRYIVIALLISGIIN